MHKILFRINSNSGTTHFFLFATTFYHFLLFVCFYYCCCCCCGGGVFNEMNENYFKHRSSESEMECNSFVDMHRRAKTRTQCLRVCVCKADVYRFCAFGPFLSFLLVCLWAVIAFIGVRLLRTTLVFLSIDLLMDSKWREKKTVFAGGLLLLLQAKNA